MLGLFLVPPTPFPFAFTSEAKSWGSVWMIERSNKVSTTPPMSSSMLLFAAVWYGTNLWALLNLKVVDSLISLNAKRVCEDDFSYYTCLSVYLFLFAVLYVAMTMLSLLSIIFCVVNTGSCLICSLSSCFFVCVWVMLLLADACWCWIYCAFLVAAIISSVRPAAAVLRPRHC